MSNEDPRRPQPIRVGGGWAFVYVILAVAFFGAAIYLVVVREAPLSSAQVLVTGLGALWFTVRAALSFSGRPR